MAADVDPAGQASGGLRPPPQGAPPQDPPGVHARRPVLGHHHLDRAGDDDVGRDASRSRPDPGRAATRARPPRSRVTRAAGTAGARAAAIAAGSAPPAGWVRRAAAAPGPRRPAAPAPGTAARPDPSRGDAEPGRRVGPGERDVDPSTAGGDGRQHLVDQARVGDPARGQVEPAYQLEVHAVGKRPDDVRRCRDSGCVPEPVPSRSCRRPGGGRPRT